MINYDDRLKADWLNNWQLEFSQAIAKRADPARHGDLPRWLASVEKLPSVQPSMVDLASDTIRIGEPSDLSEEQLESLDTGLRELIPWRKGPFDFFGVKIDTEWRSDFKWQRIQPHLSPLRDRVVLDIGCGTGYHCWRMLGDRASRVLGIDPSMRFQVQYLAAQKYLQNPAFEMLPIGVEDMPKNISIFDTVFSMGVLYHRRDPMQHLEELKSFLKTGGELVLETLVVDEAPDGVLVPKERYAQMRNVWCLFTIEKLSELLHDCGFVNISCADVNITSLEEQRTTEWMKFHSLADFLDPNDATKTIEGYPAPKRATFIATK